MLPTIYMPWFNRYFATSTALLLISFLVTLAFMLFSFHGRIKIYKTLFVYSGIVVFAIFGGRIFHLIFESHEHLQDQSLFQKLTDFNGMTYYGSLFCGMLGLYFAIKIINIPIKERNRLWDVATINCALQYGFLRIGCFCNGCCWGSITTLPWAVQYFNEDSVMPNLGIPVHPVQLYDSFLNFMLAAFLYFLFKKKRFQGELVLLYGCFYPLIRFFIEIFRGDKIRGENVIASFSTSQVLSLVFFISSIVVLRIRKKSSINQNKGKKHEFCKTI